MLTRKEVREVMKMEGEVRGATFQTDAVYVNDRGGKDALNALQEKMRNLGHPLEYNRVRAMEWLPVGLRVLSLLAIKDLFGLKDQDIKLMGYSAPAHSFIVKLFMKAFVSLELALSRVPEYWESHYSVGAMKGELDKEENCIYITIKGIKGHPILCKYLEGYIEKSLESIYSKSTITAAETECVHGGAIHHRYQVRWHQRNEYV